MDNKFIVAKFLDSTRKPVIFKVPKSKNGLFSNIDDDLLQSMIEDSVDFIFVDEENVYKQYSVTAYFEDGKTDNKCIYARYYYEAHSRALIKYYKDNPPKEISVKDPDTDMVYTTKVSVPI